jgi:hypothetical protein
LPFSSLKGTPGSKSETNSSKYCLNIFFILLHWCKTTAVMQVTAVMQARTVVPATSNSKDDSNIMTAHNNRNASNSRNESYDRTDHTVWMPTKAGMLLNQR